MKNVAEMILEMVPAAVKALREQKQMRKGGPLEAVDVDVDECNRVFAAIQALQEYRDELGCPGV